MFILLNILLNIRGSNSYLNYSVFKRDVWGIRKSSSLESQPSAEYNDEIMTQGKGVTKLGMVLCNLVDDFWGTGTWSFSL